MLSNEIENLVAQGHSCFSFDQLLQRTGSSPSALRAALRRLSKKGEIAMPLRGFYVIVAPEYRSMGCRPAEQFVPDLMRSVGEFYYAGLLSAAAYHGSAHHRPQVFQVVVAKPRRSIICGKVRVDFVVRKNAADIPVQGRNTPAGILHLSSPEATAFDLVGYARQCGGLDNVVNVLTELAEKLDARLLLEAAALSPISWTQRLGYLLESVGAVAVSDELAFYVKNRNPVRVALLPPASIQGAKTDKRWRIFINADVEPEI